MKKITIIVLSLLLISACAMKKEETIQPTHLDWYVNFSWFRHPWGQDYVSKEIRENMNVEISYNSPNISESEYLQSMINANNLPDIITLGWWDEAIEKLIEEDLVYPLGALSKEYYPEFLEAIDKDIQSYFSKGNSDFYVYPNSSYTYQNYLDSENYHSNQAFVVRKDIYEALGSPDMSTQEGFFNAMKELDDYIEHNNLDSIIPLGFHEFTEFGNDSLTEHLQNFLAIPIEVDGNYVDRFTDEDYISWLKFFRNLYHEGYLHDEVFIDQRVQIEERIKNGQYFAMIFQGSDFLEQQKELYLNNSDSIYIAIDGPKNKAQMDHQLPGSGIQGWTVTLISKNTQYPKEILELFTFLLSKEGQELIALGVEGKEYKFMNDKLVFTHESQKAWMENHDKYRSVYGGSNTHWMFQNNAMQEKLPKREVPELLQIQEWSKKYSVYGSLHYAKLKHDSKYRVDQRSIDLLWGETMIALLTSSTEAEFDEIYRKFLLRRDDLNYDEIKAEMSEVIREMKESLGMKQ